jgi:hypothetical protein
LPITDNEGSLIAAAAIIGDSSSPKHGRDSVDRMLTPLW